MLIIDSFDVFDRFVMRIDSFDSFDRFVKKRGDSAQSAAAGLRERRLCAECCRRL